MVGQRYSIPARFSRLYNKIPKHIKTGVLAWSIVGGCASLLTATMYAPQLQPLALFTAPVLVASEPLIRKHQENEAIRKLDRRYRLQQKAENLESVRLPHRNRGKQARAIDQTQLLIERALEFDGETTVIPLGGGKKSFRYVRYFFQLQTKSRMTNLQAALPHMRSMLALEDKQSLTLQEYLPNQTGFAVDVGLKEADWTHPVIDAYLTSMPQTKLIIPLGIDDTDNFQAIDVYDSSQELSAILVAGQPGSGKSNYLRSIARWIIHNYPPSVASMLLVDLKQPGSSPTFDDFLGVPHLNGRAIATSPSEFVELLEGLENERQERQRLFASEGCVNIQEFNSISPMRIPDLFVIVDEAAEMGTSKKVLHKENTKRFEELADTLNRKGRSAGIRLIWGYHRTSELDIPVSVRSNVSHNVCFKVRDPRNAALALGKELEDPIIMVPPGLSKGEFIYNERRYMALFTPTIPEEGLRLATDTISTQPALVRLVDASEEISKPPTQPDPLRTLYLMFKEYDIHKDKHSISDFIKDVLKENSNDKRAERLKQLREAIDRYADGDILNILEANPEITPEELTYRIFGNKIKHAKQETKTEYFNWAKSKLDKLKL